MNQVRVLIMALVITLAGMGAWVWKAKELQWKAEQAATKLEQSRQSDLAVEDREFAAALAQKDADQQKEIETIQLKHEQNIDALRKDEKQRISAAFEQFGSILDGNKKTVDYVNLLEQKVKSGQAISKNEAEKLSVIATALSYLQKQYQKPFKEFSELEAYLSTRADVNIESPNMKNAFWKRMFSSEFRAQEREFYRTEGERRGFQEASEKFTAAYGKAQKQMAAVNKDLESSILKLNAIADEKKSPEDLTDFFNQVRKTLTTHQQLLDFDPEISAPLPEGTRP